MLNPLVSRLSTAKKQKHPQWGGSYRIRSALVLSLPTLPARTRVHSLNVPREHPVHHSIYDQHHHGQQEVEVISFHRRLAEGVPLDAHTSHLIQRKVLGAQPKGRGGHERLQGGKAKGMSDRTTDQLWRNRLGKFPSGSAPPRPMDTQAPPWEAPNHLEMLPNPHAKPVHMCIGFPMVW